MNFYLIFHISRRSTRLILLLSYHILSYVFTYAFMYFHILYCHIIYFHLILFIYYFLFHACTFHILFHITFSFISPVGVHDLYFYYHIIYCHMFSHMLSCTVLVHILFMYCTSYFPYTVFILTFQIILHSYTFSYIMSDRIISC